MGHRLAEVTAALEGRYAIGRELGRGGMATVYLAEDLALHRPVAVKVLHAELAATLGPERFQREIAIASRLSHPDILPVYDAGAINGRLFYVMPFVDGESLRQRLQCEAQLPVPEAIGIVRAVATALDYAHGEGIVHRDIKPENILLARETAGGLPRALVADFGIARAIDAAGGEKLTETGLALGTPSYMSPEQAAAGRLDARSDIYALGCVAYEMLAGNPPFSGPTAQAILARHAVDAVPSLRTVRATVSPAVERAVERALAKVPADRFTTAGEFADALMADPNEPAGSGRPPRARATTMVLGTFAVLVAASAGAWMWRRGSTTSVIPSASTIAVLPLSSPGGDTSLTRLGRDFAVTIGTSLDGVGGITTADRLSVSSATASRSNLSTAEGAALARRLRARSLLRGTLVRVGDKVRLDLGLYSTEGLAPLVEGITVTGNRDSIGPLTDSITWALLKRVWQRGRPPTPSLAAVTTSSIPALRSFLDGEQAVEKNDWSGASLAYRSAIAADTTFALAYFGYWVAQYWNGEEPGLPFPDSSYRSRLPPRERLLVDAFAVNDSLALELDRYREVTRRYPDYWPAWFLLGDRLHHVGILLGFGWKDAQSALNTAVALNPRLLPAWEHLFLNSVGMDTIESSRALAQLPLSQMRNADLRRLVQGVARSGGVISPNLDGLADSIAQRRAAGHGVPQQQDRFPSYALVFNGFPAAQVDFDRRVMRFGADPRISAAHLWGSAWAWAQRGAWDSALSVMRRAVVLEPSLPADGGNTAVDEYAMAVLGAWLGHVSPVEAAARRPMASAVVAGLADTRLQNEFAGQLAWLDGILAFSQGDRRALDSARNEARHSGHPHLETIDRSLAAFSRALNGDRKGAGQALAALEWHCANQWSCGGPVTPNIAVHRMAAASWLLEAGDTARAARLLTWTEAKPGGGLDVSFTHAVSPLAYLMRARIEDAQGDVRSAQEHYRQFLRRFDAPMPAQHHLVDDARASLARLSGRTEVMFEP